MLVLTDRADGSVICSANPEEFHVIQQKLVLESEQDFDYYLTESTLEMLIEGGLPDHIAGALSSRMRDRGLDVGWEHIRNGSTVLSGSLVDSQVHPLGGVRVDLMQGSKLLAWTYARDDGTFSLSTGAELEGFWLRFVSRGDLVLREQAVSSQGDQGQFELQTVSGVMVTPEGEPLPGINVLLAGWNSLSEDRESEVTWSALGGQRSWADSDEQGRFSIPVHLPEDAGELEVELELTTPAGQSLEAMVLVASPENGFEVGAVTAHPAAEESTEIGVAG